jgi:hypothetical protein
MFNRFQWSSYWRESSDSPWTWVSSGFTYGDSHGWALVRTTGGQLVTLFGKVLPGRDRIPARARRTAR